MAEIPVPRSLQQIVGGMVDAFRARTGVRSLQAGSPILSIFEAAGQSDLRSSQDIFDLLNATSIDTANDLALERTGIDEDIPRLQEAASTGAVDISDTSFVKKSTTIFQGGAAPLAGTTALNVVDATGWPTSGNLYIGRSTSNYEGPIAYNGVVDNGVYWTITLTSGTSRFHNTSETVILAQGGNRQIGAGTIVRTQQANLTNATEFRTLYAATIPDGETEITGVGVVCEQAGVIGNVVRGAIKEFSSVPFAGATVTNPSPFSNGRETESREEYRDRIKTVRKSRALGTGLAMTSKVIGATATDEAKRINSAVYVSRTNEPSKLYIDDGTGYEEQSAGIAIETLIASASGGEQYFQAAQRPIARAFVATLNSAPFALSDGAVLTVRVGGTTYNHSFSASQFLNIGAASAYEVVSSINGNSAIDFSARTITGGTGVAIFGKDDTNEDVEVMVPGSGVNANAALAFPLGRNYTARLYKNDRLLTKDGELAVITGLPFSQWNAVTGSQTLIIAVDGTAAVTYTFTDQDFIDAATGFSTVGRNTVAAWIAVLNAKIPGITASDGGGRIVLTSNAGTVARASLDITGGTLTGAHFFTVGQATGKARDYVIDRNNSQIVLTTPLAVGDRLTIGSANTRAFAESGVIGTITLTDMAKMWFSVDGNAELVPTGISPSSTITVAVSALHHWGHVLSLTAGSAIFANVQKDDWLVLWDPAFDTSLQGAFRVVAATPTAITIERRLALYPRYGHRSVALNPVGADISKVFTCGGAPSCGDSEPDGKTTASCEIYDPNTKTVIAAAPMVKARIYHTATLLADGKVLVVGGVDENLDYVEELEIYNPATDQWTTSTQTIPSGLAYHQTVLLADNTVLISGGYTSGGTYLDTQYIFDPAGDTLVATGVLTAPRANHRCVLLPDTNVLVVGGRTTGGGQLASCEIWDSGTGVSGPTGALNKARSSFGLSLVGAAPTTVIAVGNHDLGDPGADSYEIYTIAAGTWAETAFPGGECFVEKDVVRAGNGAVVGLHGYTPTAQVGFIYDETVVPPLVIGSGDPLQTETVSKWMGQYVYLQNTTATVAAVGGADYHRAAAFWRATAQIEEFDANTSTWSVPDPAAGAVATLKAGLAVVRSNRILQPVEIGMGANYTAGSLVGLFNNALKGSTTSVYRTNRLRVATNSFDATGDIALVVKNDVASSMQLATSDAIDNLTGHIGSVESGNSELGTPSFEDLQVLGIEQTDTITVNVRSQITNYGVVGLRNIMGGALGASPYVDVAGTYNRSGNNYDFVTRLESIVSRPTLGRLAPRIRAVRDWEPFDRIYAAAPYAIGPSDDLSLTVDNSTDKRYSLKMWRTLQPVGAVYSQNVSFTDGDAGGASLVDAFGSNADFSDFAVYMAARSKIAVSPGLTSDMLARYYRLGPDGNRTRLRLSNPTTPDTALQVTHNFHSLDASSDVRIVLKSGALRTPTVSATTKIGLTCYELNAGEVAKLVFVANLPIASASRAANVTTLTLTLPPTITNHGFAPGNIVYVASNSGNFASGLHTITGVAPTTISYAEVAGDAGPEVSIGTVSNDGAEATFAASGAVVGDFLRIDSPPAGFPVLFCNDTFTSYGVTDSYIQTRSGEARDRETGGTVFSPSSTLSWYTIGAAGNLQIFENGSETASQITAAVNLLAGTANSKCPINLTVLGDGTGVVDRCTPEALNDYDFWYQLTDGLNWVRSAAVPPLGTDYGFTFKAPVNGDLSTDSDWANEVVRMVPTTAKNVVDWLEAPAISGLSTSCTVDASSAGRKVQIATKTAGSAGGVQVQGGLANSLDIPVVGTSRTVGNHILPGGATKLITTVRKADVAGLSVEMWSEINNSVCVPKATTIGELHNLVSWGADGLVVFGDDVVVRNVNATPMLMHFERQGRYMVLTDPSINSGVFEDEINSGDIAPGCWLRVSSTAVPTPGVHQISSANEGIYRILRCAGSSVFIENVTGIEEEGECVITVFSEDSAMPGDSFVVNTPLFGVQNQGTWTITAVGTTTATSADPFANLDRFVVDVSQRTPVPHGASPDLGPANVNLVHVVEGTPAKFIVKPEVIVPNQVDGQYTDIRWDIHFHGSSIGAAAGSIISVLDKLEFPLDFVAGMDGYRYNTGLIGEANRILYGDPANTTNYPGVAAGGAQIDISGPLVKRISIALSARLRTGVSSLDVANRIRSAVASAVNSTPTGTPVALSKIVAAASKVVGVVAVVVVSPAYGLGNDLIEVQPNEKPLVLNLDQDIQIAFTGE